MSEVAPEYRVGDACGKYLKRIAALEGQLEAANQHFKIVNGCRELLYEDIAAMKSEAEIMQVALTEAQHNEARACGRIAELEAERNAFDAQCTTYKAQIGHLHERVAELEAACREQYHAGMGYARVTHAPRIAELEAERGAHIAHLTRFRAFAAAIMRDWTEGDLEGGDRQDLAVQHGILIGTERVVPCEPSTDCYACGCGEYADEGETVTCYRLAPEIAALAAGRGT